MRRCGVTVTTRALAALIVVLAVGEARATTHHVDADGTGDYATIQAAISAAAGGDTVLLSDGVFTGDGNRDIDFLGKAILVRSESGDPATCTIDCQGSQQEPHRGFWFHSSETHDSVLDGVTVTGGYVYEEGISSGGGAVLCEGNACSPTISNCVIAGNTAMAVSSITTGGGIRFNGQSLSVLDIRHCTIANNTCDGQGGGIYCASGTVMLSDCSLSGNSAEVGGGACVGSFGNLNASGCRITGNTAGTNGSGGGVNSRGSVVLIASLISGNDAGWFGGGLCTKDAGITSCTIVGNEASWGGGICISDDYVTLWQTLVAGNTAGGGINCVYADEEQTVFCCDVWGNTGGDYCGEMPDMTGTNSNISEDPLFCDAPGGDYSVDAASCCLAANNGCGMLIGAYGLGCDSPVEQRSWGGIKALFR